MPNATTGNQQTMVRGPNPKTNTNRDGLERGNSLNIYEEHEVHAYRTHTVTHTDIHTRKQTQPKAQASCPDV